MNLELPATGEKTVETALTYDQIAELADVIIEHRSEPPFEQARHILNGGWVRSTAAGDGCDDAAGSEVAQVRKEAP